MPKRNQRHRRKVIREGKAFCKRGRIKSCHLVRIKSHARRLEREVRGSLPSIVRTPRVCRAIMAKCLLRNNCNQNRRGRGPHFVPVNHRAENHSISFRICILARDDKAPWLLVVRGWCPAGCFKNRSQLSGRKRRFGKCIRAPAGLDVGLQWILIVGWFVHQHFP